MLLYATHSVDDIFHFIRLFRTLQRKLWQATAINAILYGRSVFCRQTISTTEETYESVYILIQFIGVLLEMSTEQRR